MRQLAAFWILLTVCVISSAQQPDRNNINIKVEDETITLYNQSYALLIGISEYLGDWPDLPGVKADIYAVKAALEQHKFIVELVENPTKQEMDRAISSFIARNGQNNGNRLLFYFGGHGHTINTSYGDKLGYFVPADAPNPNIDEASFQSRAMEMAQIEIYAKRIQSKHALFVFDACFSGSLFATTRAIPQIISYKTTEPIRQFITSGTENEQVPDKSIFREQFVSALTSDMADGNRDGYLTGSELGDFLQTRVTNYSYNSQHPQFGKIRNPMLDKGDYVFIVPGHNQDIQNVAQDQTPVLGNVIEIKSAGSIELTTQIKGILLIDGKELGEVAPNTIVPINNIMVGDHLLEINGDEKWSRSVTIYKGQTTRIIAIASSEDSKYEVSRSGGFTDTRLNIEYKWIKIGNQIWMAENLNFKTREGSWCLDDDEGNCSRLGRLYDWETAIHVCPDGWHLPTDEEWKDLERSLGMNIKETNKTSFRGSREGGKLKSTEPGIWKVPNKAATDEYKFNALPGGYRLGSGEYKGSSQSAVFWSATESGRVQAKCRELYYGRSDIYRENAEKNKGFSVRCIKNTVIEFK